MYPHEIFFGLHLYELFFVGGIIAAMAIFRFLADRAPRRGAFPARLQNTVLLTTVVTIFFAYPAAILVQACYNAIRDGHFSIHKGTGATFYGGLIGGVVAFLIFYLIYGHFTFKNKEHLRDFPLLLDLAPAAITLAHGLGRIGCLMAGCCHGNLTDSFLGVELYGKAGKYVPTQLYEACFLFLLCYFLATRFLAGKKHNMSLYCLLYGIWRFLIETLRADDRGETIVSFLTPSQLTSLFLLVIAIVLYLCRKHIYDMETRFTTSESGK